MAEQHGTRRPIAIVAATADPRLHAWVARWAPPGAALRGCARDRGALLRLVRDGRVDVCLVDVAVPAGAGAVIAMLAAVAPGVRTLAWAATDDDPALIAALEAGAAGCLAGTPGGAALGRALDDLMAGRPPVPRALVAQLIALMRPA